MAKEHQKLNHRLTVVETCYHQRLGEDPVEVVSRYGRALGSEDHIYERHLTATNKWVPLDCGWVEHTSLLILKNDEGKFLFSNPTDEKRAEVAARIIEVTEEPCSHNVWLIRPEESMRACPTNPQALYVRCQAGKAKFTLYLFPE